MNQIPDFCGISSGKSEFLFAFIQALHRHNLSEEEKEMHYLKARSRSDHATLSLYQKHSPLAVFPAPPMVAAAAARLAKLEAHQARQKIKSP